MGGPSIPKPQALAAPPLEEDKAVQEAAAEASRKRQSARGYRSTILSQSLSPTSPALQQTLGS